jgi:hypothetical protein
MAYDFSRIKQINGTALPGLQATGEGPHYSRAADLIAGREGYGYNTECEFI